MSLQIFGPESSGKTTLALHAIAEAQKAGRTCVFIDAEHALDKVYARVGKRPLATIWLLCCSRLVGWGLDLQKDRAWWASPDAANAPLSAVRQPRWFEGSRHVLLSSFALTSVSNCSFSQALGVDVDQMLLVQPDCGEDALEIADQLARTGEFGMVVVDSVSALVPRVELEGEIGQVTVGAQARMMSSAMRKLCGSLAKGKTTLLFLNQIRLKVGEGKGLWVLWQTRCESRVRGGGTGSWIDSQQHCSKAWRLSAYHLALRRLHQPCKSPCARCSCCWETHT